MALSSFPGSAKYAWGSTVYFLNPSTNKIQSGTVDKITAVVTDPAGDSSGNQLNLYTISGYTAALPESKVFHSKNALLYSLKGAHLNVFNGATLGGILTKGTSNDYSYSDFTGVDFKPSSSGSNLAGVVLDGCNLTNADLGSADLTNASLKYATLTGATLTSAVADGANFTGATMPANADTKSEFKALVASYTGAIWTDGTTVT